MSKVLSFSKFANLTSKNDYSLVTAYCEKKSVKFIEVRTAEQNTFIIHVPLKYNMKVDKDACKIVKIVKNDKLKESKQLQHIIDIKDNNTNQEYVSISSKMLVYYRLSGVVEHYYYSDFDFEEDFEDIDDDDYVQEDVKKLISETQKTEKKPEKENTEKDSEEKIELVFEKEKKKTVKRKRIVQIPPDIENADILVGIVICCYDLTEFYKKIKTLPSEINSFYFEIQTREQELRNTRIKKIEELTGLLLKKTIEKIETFYKIEDEINKQVEKINSNITELEEMKNKVVNNKHKYGNMQQSDMDTLRMNYKKTLRDLNIDLYKNRDEIDEYLNSIQISLGILLE